MYQKKFQKLLLQNGTGINKKFSKNKFLNKIKPIF
jgi:hypothetical protein